MSARDELTAAPLSPEREAEIRAMAVAAPLRIMMEDVVGCRVGLRDLLGEIDRLRADRNAYRAEWLREAADAVALDRDSTNPSGGKGAYRRGMTRAEELLRRMADAAEQPGGCPKFTVGSIPGLCAACADHRKYHRADAEQGEKDTREGESTPQPAELTIYRASHDSIVMGLYTTREAARAHCAADVRREFGHAGTLGWVPDDGSTDSPEELSVFGPGADEEGPDEMCTGYIVTPLTVTSAYDEEADE